MVEKRDQLLLAGLAEGDTIGGKLALQPLECIDFRRVWEQRDMALNAVLAIGDPLWDEAIFMFVVRLRRPLGKLKDQPPDVIAGLPGREGVPAVGGGDVAADGVPLVPMDTALPLFEIDRIARKIPVDQSVAPGVEVEPLLTDGRTGQDKRTERTVEGRSHRVLADVLIIFSANMAETQSEHSANADFFRTISVSVPGSEEPRMNA